MSLRPEMEWSCERIAKFYADLQKIEIRTMHYLGVAYLVLSRSPQLKLKVPISTLNYDDTQNPSSGSALQLIFTCPANYPLEKPQVEIVEKRNISKHLEDTLMVEISQTLDQHFGLQMIVPVVTKIQMVLNEAVRRSRRQY